MPLDRADALKIASEAGFDPDGAVETQHGWYFPLAEAVVGCNGAIIGKSDGAVFSLGSAYSVERDIHFFDRGFRSDVYDLVVLEIFDLRAAVALIAAIGPTVVEPTYEYDVVWRIPRPLSETEIADRLAALPALFPDVHLYFRLELLEQAEKEHVFSYRALGRRQR
jgi:hypothetical protein